MLVIRDTVRVDQVGDNVVVIYITAAWRGWRRC